MRAAADLKKKTKLIKEHGMVVEGLSYLYPLVSLSRLCHVSSSKV